MSTHDINPALGEAPVLVYRGPRAGCLEFSLVLAARDLRYEMREHEGLWELSVPAHEASRAREELDRYAEERRTVRAAPVAIQPFGAAGAGAVGYAAVLLLTAYCAGNQAFGVDWLDAGSLATGPAGGEWWRPVTALTLHYDQAHLLGNLLFGVLIGGLACRLFGAGIAWACILAAGTCANALEMLVAPPPHRAAGASTAVFAALGLLTGFTWRLRLGAAERFRYRWAPLFAGVCLLGFLGAGPGAEVGAGALSAGRVDVLGHVLGFAAGTAFGWTFVRHGAPRLYRDRILQGAAGAVTLAAIAAAWIFALRAARGSP